MKRSMSETYMMIDRRYGRQFRAGGRGWRSWGAESARSLPLLLHLSPSLYLDLNSFAPTGVQDCAIDCSTASGTHAHCSFDDWNRVTQVRMEQPGQA